MLDYNGTPYVGLTCEVYAHDPSAENLCGNYIGTAFNNLLIFLAVNTWPSTSPNWSSVINNDFTFFSDKVLSLELFDFVTWQTSLSFSSYIPSAKQIDLPGADYDNSTLKWYDPQRPDFYLTSWDQHYRLYSGGTLIDSIDRDTAGSYIFASSYTFLNGNPYFHTFSGSYINGVYQLQKLIDVYRYRGNIRSSAENASNNTRRIINAFLNGLPDYKPEDDDPYQPGGYSGPGGGDGTFDFTSTDIPIPALPGIGAYDTGFISLYRPNATELHSLASYMWSSAFDINNFIKIFADPGDCILGLHIIPTSGTHPEGASATLTVGNISTGLYMTRLTEQYFEVDCGTVSISPKWGAYLDYSPYSKLSLYLPYIGFVPISPDDCMGGTIKVVYHVDVLSGSCCAYVYCTSNRGADGHTLYTFTGSCACVCPVTEGQYTNGIIGSIRGGVGLAAGLATGNILGGLEDAANALISMAKPDISRSGSFGGSAGLMGIQYPYLVLTVPKMCTPGQQNTYVGYPSFVTTELSEVTGFASIKITHLEGMSATDEEITELVGLLEEGVIL